MDATPSARGSILIVDDDERIRESVAEMLLLRGYRVFTAGNGQEALKQLQKALPSLILLDVMMPVMDGFDFRAQLLKDPVLASIPVVVTSGISAAYQLKGHLQSVAYLEKPFNTEQLLEQVRRYCG
jgi:CheY-like chemotaxis protein